MDPIGLEALRGVADPEMRQLVIDPQPALSVAVVMGYDLICKKRQGRIADPCQKTHQRIIGEKIDSPVYTQIIEQNKQRRDQEGDVGVGSDIDPHIDRLQKDHSQKRQALDILP